MAQPADGHGRSQAEHRTVLSIHVQPKARRTEVVGWHGDAIKIRVAAPPVDGAANEELRRFLGEELGVPKSAVTIGAGATGRRKRVEIEGCPPERALRTLGLG